MAPFRSPVVAVEAGRVKYWESGLGGCMLYLYGRSGTMYMYIHLNNDVTPRNDNRGRCYEVAFTVKDGAKVAAVRGNLVTAGAGTVELAVERVRHYPGGRWLDVDPRTVELAVPPEAVVAPSLRVAASAGKRETKAITPVVAHTVTAKTTIDTILGASGALTAARVSPAR